MIIFLNLPCHIIMSKCHPNPRDLDKILPTGLQNCPRAYGPWAVLEALGQDFIQNPSGLGWHFLPLFVVPYFKKLPICILPTHEHCHFWQ